MQNLQKSLEKKIKETLTPLITSDYVYLNLHYHNNIGDLLIWKGTEDFLSELPYKCLGKASPETYVKPLINEDITVLLQGGGNFGDIWRNSKENFTEIMLQVLRELPQNKVIVFPQTVFYHNQKTMKKDAREMAKHPNLTICARDNQSYQYLCDNFANKILLVPDMAFCIKPESLKLNSNSKKSNQDLFLKRTDKEYFDYSFSKYIKSKNLDIADWPSIVKDKKLLSYRILRSLLKINKDCMKFNILVNLSSNILNYYAENYYLPLLVKTGVEFISRYDKVYSTRLHGAILGMLLNKEVIFFENSYHKNRSFYDTWIKKLNLKNVTFIYNDNVA